MGKGIGERVREYLTEKMGNPVMDSKRKKAVDEIDDVKSAPTTTLHEMQEKGEDYDTRRYHRRGNI